MCTAGAAGPAPESAPDSLSTTEALIAAVVTGAAVYGIYKGMKSIFEWAQTRKVGRGLYLVFPMFVSGERCGELVFSGLLVHEIDAHAFQFKFVI